VYNARHSLTVVHDTIAAIQIPYSVLFTIQSPRQAKNISSLATYTRPSTVSRLADDPDRFHATHAAMLQPPTIALASNTSTFAEE